VSDLLIQQAIAELVPQGARVLDLGCGDGAMLAHLQQTRGCTGYGMEIDDANVLACVRRGVNVIQLNLDEGLAMFDDASFDVVLQIDTLQHLRNAEVMLRETVRVGALGIVAFPNFAHWPNRLSVLKGRMPVTKRLPYQWYDTPNIRVGTHADFWPSWQRATACGYRTALACRMGAPCVGGPISGPVLRSTSFRSRSARSPLSGAT
jgi:methionine biosynthesis protein MetW